MEVPLKHGQYDGTPYSTGTAVMGDDTFHWVITEGDEGPRMGVRVLNANSPAGGRFLEGKAGKWAQRLLPLTVLGARAPTRPTPTDSDS